LWCVQWFPWSSNSTASNEAAKTHSYATPVNKKNAGELIIGFDRVTRADICEYLTMLTSNGPVELMVVDLPKGEDRVIDCGAFDDVVKMLQCTPEEAAGRWPFLFVTPYNPVRIALRDKLRKGEVGVHNDA
jgi:hypothetical protein